MTTMMTTMISNKNKLQNAVQHVRREDVTPEIENMQAAGMERQVGHHRQRLALFLARKIHAFGTEFDIFEAGESKEGGEGRRSVFPAARSNEVVAVIHETMS